MPFSVTVQYGTQQQEEEGETPLEEQETLPTRPEKKTKQ
jgi:hypothetical protein